MDGALTDAGPGRDLCRCPGLKDRDDVVAKVFVGEGVVVLVGAVSEAGSSLVEVVGFLSEVGDRSEAGHGAGLEFPGGGGGDGFAVGGCGGGFGVLAVPVEDIAEGEDPDGAGSAGSVERIGCDLDGLAGGAVYPVKIGPGVGVAVVGGDGVGACGGCRVERVGVGDEQEVERFDLGRCSRARR